MLNKEGRKHTELINRKKANRTKEKAKKIFKKYVRRIVK